MDVNDQLRAWAKGTYTTEAATELLIRVFGGRFADPSNAWIHPTNHGYWIDFDGVSDNIGVLSDGEQRLLRIAASIGSSDVLVNLSDDISGLDRQTLHLVLAALAHAAGSHEHSDVIVDVNGRASFIKESSLYPWDEDAAIGGGRG